MQQTLLTIRETLGGFIAPSLIERRNAAERAANTDALTGLANRAAYDKAAPSLSPLESVVIFDLNNFGKVNKVCGHSTGDALLREFAAVIGQAAKMYKGRAFRLGGDEFIIIITADFAEQVRDSVERRAPVRSFPGFVVSISGEIGETLDKADSKLQTRKAERKAA